MTELDGIAMEARTGGGAAMETLAWRTIRIAGAVVAGAVSRGRLPAYVAEDVVMGAVERALARLGRWEPVRGSWSTFAGMVARTEVARARAEYKRLRMQRLAAMETWPEGMGRGDMELAARIRRK